MFDLILIRFGELSLKGKNKMNFVFQLAKNISQTCNIKNKDLDIQIDRIYIPYSNNNMEKLNYVFGISSFSPVYIVETDLQKIKNKIIETLPTNISSFKINARRHWKGFEKDSLTLNKELGSFIINKFNYVVDVKNPEYELYIEIHQKSTYLFFTKIKGLGGLPVSSSGKVIHLLSGGIDSPVAAYKMMKRGVKVIFLAFISPPHTDQKTIDKLNLIVQTLNQYQNNSQLILFNYTNLMNYIGLVTNQAYKIILMRRSFYRIATKIAKQFNCLGISNGENLAQVASQTMEAMNVIHKASDLAIYQPLLTNDKIETIEMAQKINTFNVSIIKACETCEMFAPSSPITKPNLNQVIKLEEELNLLNKLEEESLNKNIIIKNIKK